MDNLKEVEKRRVSIRNVQACIQCCTLHRRRSWHRAPHTRAVARLPSPPQYPKKMNTHRMYHERATRVRHHASPTHHHVSRARRTPQHPAPMRPTIPIAMVLAHDLSRLGRVQHRARRSGRRLEVGLGVDHVAHLVLELVPVPACARVSGCALLGLHASWLPVCAPLHIRVQHSKGFEGNGARGVEARTQSILDHVKARVHACTSAHRNTGACMHVVESTAENNVPSPRAQEQHATATRQEARKCSRQRRG